MHAGHIDEALAVVDDALAEASGKTIPFYEAELLRLRGELLRKQTIPMEAEAESCFRRAVDIARRQQAKALELRAVTSLSRLLNEQGRCDEARQRLAETCGWFTEGFGTVDLQEARALLEGLS